MSLLLCMFVLLCMLFSYVLVLVIGPYTMAVNAAASVQAFPWMGPKSTTSFIRIVRSFTFRPNHGHGTHLLIARRRKAYSLVLASLYVLLCMYVLCLFSNIIYCQDIPRSYQQRCTHLPESDQLYELHHQQHHGEIRNCKGMYVYDLN